MALSKALECEKSADRVFLVMEEMSRANVAAVFGDLFQLLDRDDNGISEYKIRNDLIANYIRENSKIDLSNNNIYLPSNLYIYGTVNTSDQNVFVMDNEYKRRFEFEYVGTQPVKDKDENPINEYEFELDSSVYKWSEFYQRFNSYVTGIMGLREDKQIGPFFLRFKGKENSEVEEYNYNQIKNKLLQYFLANPASGIPIDPKDIVNGLILPTEHGYNSAVHVDRRDVDGLYIQEHYLGIRDVMEKYIQ